MLARVTREAIEAENATLLLRDEEDRVEHVLTVGANDRFEEVFRELVGSVPAQDFRAWRIASRQPKPIFVENARASRLLPPDLVEALSLKSYVVVPLVSATRPLGLVILSHTQAPRPWSNEERRLVEQLALEGSLVVENAALRATEQERIEELAHQAFHDSLTELPNRALFADRLAHALERTNRRKAAVAVLFLDLDDFKPINDNFGHEAGDRLLTAVAQRIKACVRPEDTVARLGGDEFTVLLEDIADVRYAIAVAERIEASLQDPFRVEGEDATVTASVGIAVSSGPRVDARRPDPRLRRGDVPGEAQGPGAPRGVPRRRPTGRPESPTSRMDARCARGAESPSRRTRPPTRRSPSRRWRGDLDRGGARVVRAEPEARSASTRPSLALDEAETRRRRCATATSRTPIASTRAEAVALDEPSQDLGEERSEPVTDHRRGARSSRAPREPPARPDEHSPTTRALADAHARPAAGGACGSRRRR